MRSQTKITFDICIKVGLISLIALLCAGIVHGRNLTECVSGINESYMVNTRVNCSAYELIFCNGSQSQLCIKENDCNESYECESTSLNITTVSPVKGDNNSTIVSSDAPPPSSSESNTTVATITDGSTTEAPITDGSTTKTDVRHECVLGVNAKFVFPDNCNYYYHCIDGYLLVQQCPFGYYFNAPAGVCLGPVANVNYYC